MTDKAKILVVDDSDTKRGMYTEMLKREGYTVIEARDGEEGIKKAMTQSPDAIIADVAMPKMDGIEMVTLLKKENSVKYVPIICISATFKDIATKFRALIEAGAEEFFYMPEIPRASGEIARRPAHKGGLSRALG